jgi:hypothetical protein
MGFGISFLSLLHLARSEITVIKGRLSHAVYQMNGVVEAAGVIRTQLENVGLTEGNVAISQLVKIISHFFSLNPTRLRKRRNLS